MGDGFFERGPMVIAGPCALDDREVNLAIARRLAELASRWGVPVIFKASFDKANRSSGASPRGPGLAAGLALLAEIKSAVGLAVLTDIHEPAHAAAAAGVVDALQIPAFLCRQSDLLAAAGATGLPVNIKKGQWMDAAGMAHAVAKVRSAGSSAVAVTERGTFFGYGDLVVDMRNFRRIEEKAGVPVIFDVTHSVQRPGLGAGGRSGGDREAAPALARAAVAAGARGLFVETHPDPAAAPSDSETMWPLAGLGELVEPCLELWRSMRHQRVTQ